MTADNVKLHCNLEQIKIGAVIEDSSKEKCRLTSHFIWRSISEHTLLKFSRTICFINFVGESIEILSLRERINKKYTKKTYFPEEKVIPFCYLEGGFITVISTFCIIGVRFVSL